MAAHDNNSKYSEMKNKNINIRLLNGISGAAFFKRNGEKYLLPNRITNLFDVFRFIPMAAVDYFVKIVTQFSH